MPNKLICWWIGHRVDSKAFGYDGDEYIWFCHRCERDDVDFYEAAVEPSRYQKVKTSLAHWLFRKWFPEKCKSCGNRYKCNDDIDHIPF